MRWTHWMSVWWCVLVPHTVIQMSLSSLTLPEQCASVLLFLLSSTLTGELLPCHTDGVVGPCGILWCPSTWSLRYVCASRCRMSVRVIICPNCCLRVDVAVTSVRELFALKAAHILEKAGINPHLVFDADFGNNAMDGAICGKERVNYCGIPLPLVRHLLPSDTAVAQRLFIVCQPCAIPERILRDAFSRFANLIDVFLLTGGGDVSAVVVEHFDPSAMVDFSFVLLLSFYNVAFLCYSVFIITSFCFLHISIFMFGINIFTSRGSHV